MRLISPLHFFEAAYQEVIPAEPALEGAEGMFNQCGTLGHALRSFGSHALALVGDSLGMFAAIDAALGVGLGQTSGHQRTALVGVRRAGVAGAQRAVFLLRLSAGTEDLPPPGQT